MDASAFIKNRVQNILGTVEALDLTDPQTITRNFLFLYHVTKASEDLLKVALAETEWGTVLNTYFSQHLEEEKEHHKWLASDLKSKGVLAAESIVPRQAVELVGSQYYLIKHVNPVCLLGYMLVLEGDPMPLEQVEALEAVHGDRFIATLRYHATHDVEHSKDLCAVIDELSDAEKFLVLESAVQSAVYLADAWNSFR